jgi:hypothetical protein
MLLSRQMQNIGAEIANVIPLPWPRDAGASRRRS